MSSKTTLIRTIYLYAVSLITLVMIIIAASQLINLGLKTWVFTKADRPDYFEPACPMSVPVEKSGIVATSSTQETCDAYTKNQQENYQYGKQSQAIDYFSMLLVASPLFFFHWRLAKKEKDETNN